MQTRSLLYFLTLTDSNTPAPLRALGFNNLTLFVRDAVKLVNRIVNFFVRDGDLAALRPNAEASYRQELRILEM